MAGTLRRGLDAVRGLEGLDLLGEVGRTRTLFLVRLMAAGRKPGLELVTKSGQLGEVGIVREEMQVRPMPPVASRPSDQPALRTALVRSAGLGG